MRILLVQLLCLVMAGCGNVAVERYASEAPALDLARFFSGPVQAWGIFENRSGEVVKRFNVEINSRREGERLILDERFVYSDGSREQRIWTLTPNAEGGWSGTAGDVDGVARGRIAGNAFHWRYKLELPVGGSTWVMNMDDWMYLVDENTLVNRTAMSKFGIEVGQVTVFFRRQAGDAQ